MLNITDREIVRREPERMRNALAYILYAGSTTGQTSAGGVGYVGAQEMGTEGMSEGSEAKLLRKKLSPESQGVGPDMGFGSPWKGIARLWPKGILGMRISGHHPAFGHMGYMRANTYLGDVAEHLERGGRQGVDRSHYRLFSKSINDIAEGVRGIAIGMSYVNVPQIVREFGENQMVFAFNPVTFHELKIAKHVQRINRGIAGANKATGRELPFRYKITPVKGTDIDALTVIDPQQIAFIPTEHARLKYFNKNRLPQGRLYNRGIDVPEIWPHELAERPLTYADEFADLDPKVGGVLVRLLESVGGASRVQASMPFDIIRGLNPSQIRKQLAVDLGTNFESPYGGVIKHVKRFKNRLNADGIKVLKHGSSKKFTGFFNQPGQSPNPITHAKDLLVLMSNRSYATGIWSSTSAVKNELKSTLQYLLYQKEAFIKGQARAHITIGELLLSKMRGPQRNNTTFGFIKSTIAHEKTHAANFIYGNKGRLLSDNLSDPNFLKAHNIDPSVVNRLEQSFSQWYPSQDTTLLMAKIQRPELYKKRAYDEMLAMGGQLRYLQDTGKTDLLGKLQFGQYQDDLIDIHRKVYPNGIGALPTAIGEMGEQARSKNFPSSERGRKRLIKKTTKNLKRILSNIPSNYIEGMEENSQFTKLLREALTDFGSPWNKMRYLKGLTGDGVKVLRHGAFNRGHGLFVRPSNVDNPIKFIRDMLDVASRPEQAKTIWGTTKALKEDLIFSLGQLLYQKDAFIAGKARAYISIGQETVLNKIHSSSASNKNKFGRLRAMVVHEKGHALNYYYGSNNRPLSDMLGDPEFVKSRGIDPDALGRLREGFFEWYPSALSKKSQFLRTKNKYPDIYYKRLYDEMIATGAEASNLAKAGNTELLDQLGLARHAQDLSHVYSRLFPEGIDKLPKGANIIGELGEDARASYFPTERKGRKRLMKRTTKNLKRIISNIPDNYIEGMEENSEFTKLLREILTDFGSAWKRMRSAFDLFTKQYKKQIEPLRPLLHSIFQSEKGDQRYYQWLNLKSSIISARAETQIRRTRFHLLGEDRTRDLARAREITKMFMPWATDAQIDQKIIGVSHKMSYFKDRAARSRVWDVRKAKHFENQLSTQLARFGVSWELAENIAVLHPLERATTEETIKKRFFYNIQRRAVRQGKAAEQSFTGLNLKNLPNLLQERFHSAREITSMFMPFDVSEEAIDRAIVNVSHQMMFAKKLLRKSNEMSNVKILDEARFLNNLQLSFARFGVDWDLAAEIVKRHPVRKTKSIHRIDGMSEGAAAKSLRHKLNPAGVGAGPDRGLGSMARGLFVISEELINLFDSTGPLGFATSVLQMKQMIKGQAKNPEFRKVLQKNKGDLAVVKEILSHKDEPLGIGIVNAGAYKHYYDKFGNLDISDVERHKFASVFFSSVAAHEKAHANILTTLGRENINRLNKYNKLVENWEAAGGNKKLYPKSPNLIGISDVLKVDDKAALDVAEYSGDYADDLFGGVPEQSVKSNIRASAIDSLKEEAVAYSVDRQYLESKVDLFTNAKTRAAFMRTIDKESPISSKDAKKYAKGYKLIMDMFSSNQMVDNAKPYQNTAGVHMKVHGNRGSRHGNPGGAG